MAMEQRMVDLIRNFYKPKIDDFDNLIRGCESPIEEKLIGKLASQLDPKTRVTGQWKIAGYRADFMVEVRGLKTIIECDGKEFHNYPDDVQRDLKILDSGEVNRIIRFRGCDIVFQMDECLRVLRDWMPEAFGESQGNIIASHVSICGTCLPIIRVRLGREEMNEKGEKLKQLIACEICKSFGATAGRESVIAQFKSPNWNRDLGPMAGHVVSMGDLVMDFVRNEMS